MSKHYFSQLPNIRYKNPLESSNQNNNYILAKNLFLRTKIRDDASLDITFLQSYTIREGERPEDVAEAVILAVSLPKRASLREIIIKPRIAYL